MAGEALRARFLTAVWGQWHSDAFLTQNLPSLLAEGNLPQFHRLIPSVYQICTRQSDAQKIRAATSVLALQNMMPVEVEELPDADFADPVETHTRIWRNNVERARRDGAVFTAVPADMVWADGTFRTIAGRLRSGFKAIYAMFIRVVDETFSEEFRTIYGDRVASVVSLTARRLMEMTLRHIHPMHCAYLRDSNYFPFHPEYVLWPVPGEGFLMRSFATTVLTFDPSHFDVNHQYSLATCPDPREVAFIDDSDEVYGVSITPLLKDRDWYARPGRLDIDDIGAWWNAFDGPAHRYLASHRFRFHSVPVTEALWRRIEAQSDFLVVQSSIAKEMIWIGRFLLEHGHRLAAACFAVAYYYGKLRRKWIWRGPVTIFCPTDEAFSEFSKEELDSLFAPGREAELVDLIEAHIAVGRIDIPMDEGSLLAEGAAITIETLVGGRVTIAAQGSTVSANEVKISARHDLSHGSTIYEIGRVLAGGI